MSSPAQIKVKYTVDFALMFPCEYAVQAKFSESPIDVLFFSTCLPHAVLQGEVPARVSS